MDLVYYIGHYIGQIVCVKTTNGDILLVKVLSKYSKRPKGYKVKILDKNGQNLYFDSIISNEEINRICILPREVQQGIELTIGNIPNLKEIENLTSEVEFGKEQDNE
nr:hypothetical protein [Fredinandcohnia onubensis]